MKARRILYGALLGLLLILEALPYGAVCNFARPPEEGGVWRRTFSYFDLTPYGYANFGPFLTAVLTCVLVVLFIVALFVRRRALRTALLAVNIAAVATSLLPLLYGLSYISVVGGIITVLLIAAAGVQAYGMRRDA